MARTRRVMVVVDADNTNMSARSFNRRVDWEKIKDYLADPKEGRELIEMVLYVGLPPDRERFKAQRKSKEKFVFNQFLEWKGRGGEACCYADVLMLL